MVSSAQVNDLEVELNSTKQKSIENLEMAILAERERFTQLQWEMEELRHKSFEMEKKLMTRQVIDTNIAFPCHTFFVLFSVSKLVCKNVNV